MKVYLDTNVWISAILSHGLCEGLLRFLIRAHGKGRIELLVGKPVLEEVFRVLREKLEASREMVGLARALAAHGRLVGHSGEALPGTISDPSDIPILACAIAATADVFVTGDAALLQLGKIEDMPILAPRTCYERLIGLG